MKCEISMQYIIKRILCTQRAKPSLKMRSLSETHQPKYVPEVHNKDCPLSTSTLIIPQPTQPHTTLNFYISNLCLEGNDKYCYLPRLYWLPLLITSLLSNIVGNSRIKWWRHKTEATQLLGKRLPGIQAAGISGGCQPSGVKDELQSHLRTTEGF